MNLKIERDNGTVKEIWGFEIELPHTWLKFIAVYRLEGQGWRFKGVDKNVLNRPVPLIIEMGLKNKIIRQLKINDIQGFILG